MAGLVPAIRVFKRGAPASKTWLPGTRFTRGPAEGRTRVPGMTEFGMSPDLYFWLALAIKMVVAALFVIAATVTAEKSSPAIGALVATLPISAGPAYVFLALDHPPDFIAQAALASLSLNAVTAIYATVYVLLAQRYPLSISLPLAFATWLGLAILLGFVAWTASSAVILNLVVFPLCHLVVRRFRHVRMPPTRRRWYDIGLRALLVATLVALVVTLSFRIGPAATGVLAAFPAVFTSIMFLLHWRMGGHATAAVLASAIPGLGGFGAAVLTLHFAAIPLGLTGALVLALAVSMAWNLTLYAGQRRAARRLKTFSPPPASP